MRGFGVENRCPYAPETIFKTQIMALIDNIIARAKSNKQRIVLPESLEERTITAADQALRDGLADSLRCR